MHASAHPTCMHAVFSDFSLVVVACLFTYALHTQKGRPSGLLASFSMSEVRLPPSPELPGPLNPLNPQPGLRFKKLIFACS